jgi:nucleotidyltransferase substrate binding protein (TIGR01987 family)
MVLDLSTFENAINQLSDSLIQYQSNIVQENPKLQTHMRAGAIQAFEFTYELSHKMLKRYLENTEPSADVVEAMAFETLIRTGNERGLLLSDVASWRNYRAKRGATIHTYNEEKAEVVFENIPIFLMEAKYLLKALKEKIS